MRNIRFINPIQRRRLWVTGGSGSDLILLDVILPDMEGMNCLKKIKAKDKNHAPVIFITSKTVNRM